MKNYVDILVGGYSQAADNALCVYRYNRDDRHARLLGAMPVANASFAACAPDGMIYAVTESDTENSWIHAIRDLAIVNRQPVRGNSPCYVAVSPDGRNVFTANYGDGTVSAFAVRADGSLSPMVQQLQLTGSGPVPRRQACARAHCVVFTPDGRYALVSNLGADHICTFALTGNSEHPLDQTPRHIVALEPGSGPRHIIFNAEGNKAYVINEIADTVTVFGYADGVLTPVQTIAADTADAHGAGDIALTADGRFLFASLRLKHEGIATFAVEADGTLRLLRHTTTGGHPRRLCMGADGATLYAACRDADAVEVYGIDPVDATLHLRHTITHARAVFVSEV